MRWFSPAQLTYLIWNATTRTIQTVTGNVNGSVGSVTGAVGSVTGAVGSVTGAVGSVTGNVGGNVTGSVGSVVGNVGGNVTGSVGSVVAAPPGTIVHCHQVDTTANFASGNVEVSISLPTTLASVANTMVVNVWVISAAGVVQAVGRARVLSTTAMGVTLAGAPGANTVVTASLLEHR